MLLQEFFDYKNQMMEDILTDKEIVRLLCNGEAPEDVSSLAYTQVFPCEYIPETVQDGMTFICFDVDIQRTVDKTFLDPTVYVWVFTHRSLLRLPEGGIRTDRLCSELCRVLNGSRKYGLGELDLYAVRRFAPLTDFQGKVMTFSARDFNRLYDGKKYTPANRKA